MNPFIAPLLIGIVGGVMVDSHAKEDPNRASPSSKERLLMRFIQISDTQIIDEESPARAIRLDNFVDASWRPQEAFGVHALNATNRVINKIHRGELNGRPARPIDFVIQTGDAVDLAAENEMKWFMTAMDGGLVHPDSGQLEGKDSPVQSELNPNLAFTAEGLASDIPWYTVYGNHDGLAMGVFTTQERQGEFLAPVPSLIARLIGLHHIDPLKNELFPKWDHSPAIVRANQDVAHPQTLRLEREKLKHGPIEIDESRQFMTRKKFVHAHFYPESRSEPDGHGFGPTNQETGWTYYSVRPKKDVPVRLIVLDTIATSAASEKFAFAGMMARDQFEQFLKPELEKAKKAGEFVIIASHHPSKDFQGYYVMPKEVGMNEFRSYLSSQPHVLAHICGHSHRHRMTMIQGNHPYPEIETSSIIDYPQEGRIFEIYFHEETRVVRLESHPFSYLDDDRVLPIERELRRRVEADAKLRSLEHEIGDGRSSLLKKVLSWDSEIKELSPYIEIETSFEDMDRHLHLKLPRPAFSIQTK